MSKKRKPTSAQDLIDSLLDESSDAALVSVKQADAKARASVMSPSEIHHAPTVVVNPEDKHKASEEQPAHMSSEESGSSVLELASAPGGDKTVRLPIVKSGAKAKKADTEIRFGFAQPGSGRRTPAVGTGSGAIFTSAEASLKQSENLRIAQTRINELENELERLRRDNERLASAGETIRRRSDELAARADHLESQVRESQKIFEEEKKVLRGQLAAKERETAEQRQKIEEMEHRLEANFKKIRVRERELEHRLEIVRMESATLVSTKDEMIMRLKREIDQLKFETENGKARSQELYNQYREKQETIQRVVRALRIALTILEGDEEVTPVKKAE